MNFTKANNLDVFFETSAKTGHNIEEVFEEAARLLVQKHEMLEAMNGRKRTKSKIKVPEPVPITPVSERKRGCC